ncbi:MAG: hypothetical protein P1U87_02855 [Verrucomicrobiales bacterium]|nr:hypothetical protein [Verrucomicrobiales bacterium]
MDRYETRTTIARTLQVYTEPPILDVDALSETSGFHRDLIKELEHAGMIPAVSVDWRGEPLFDCEAIPRCSLIRKLHQRENMSFHLIRQWLEVLNRLEKVEIELEQYRRT